MKFITFLFTVFFWFNAVAVAPYGFKGQQQSQTLYSNVLQGQNNLVTNMGGINALLETGNKNILTNPSFEHATFSTGWTNSAGTFTAETSLEIDGLKAAKLVLSSQTMSLTQSSTLYASQFADGVQGLASIRVKSSVALKVCSIQAGTVSTTNCVDVQATSKWGLYKIPFILGATSNGISINSNGASVTGTVYIDDAFVGAVDLKADVDASRVAGEAYFAGTASCLWNRTSATVGAFTASATCPGPTIVTSTMGQWQTTDSDLPRVTINNLPAGTYKAKFIVREFMSLATNQPVLAINDGTTTCEPISVNESNISAVSQIVECTFVYTNSGNRVFELYGASPSNTITAANIATAPRASTKFILEYFGSGSVYSSTNADTDWASCTPGSIQGFTSPTYNIQCKRQGGDLLMKGRFSFTTVSAVEARLGLPVWNGAQLVSAGSSQISTLEVANGFYVRSTASTEKGGSILIAPSISYFAFGSAFTFSGSSLVPLATALATNVSAGNENISFNARIPIEGWQNSNIIIGQFNGLESCTSTLECTDTFSAKISAAGVTSEENVDFINGSCSLATNVYTCNFNSSIFTVAPTCTITPLEPTAINGTMGMITTQSSSSVVYKTVRHDSAALTAPVNIICQKQGVDYIGKTAKAVASDQNLRTPGITKGVVHSCRVNNNGTATLDSASGTCSSFISSVIRTSAGAVSINFSGSSFLLNPICTISSAQSGAYRVCQFDAAPTTSTALSVCANGATTPADTAFNIICHGVSP